MGVKLIALSGPMAGREFDFGKPDVFIFGRATDCHFCLPDDPYVSRHHFLLEVNPPQCQLRDLGSLNGTYVNDARYGGRREGEEQSEAAKRAVAVEVKSGDRIKVGKTSLQVTADVYQMAELPASCIKCGKEIRSAEREELAYIGGTHLCRDCRKQVAPAPLASVKEPQVEGAQLLEDLIVGLFGKAEGGFPQIPGYEFVRELGRGGFGKVYLVRRQREGKQLALKVLLSRKRKVRQEDIKVFQREMEICMALKHPHLVAFEEQGHANGLFYFVMEYCPGGSLRDLMHKRGGSLKVEEAVPLILQALDGLAHAHEKGFVHRDLKPENILLDHALKTARISDFGLAKNFQQAGLSGFTLSGAYAGTQLFMPKEQITDFRYVKPVSDIFSMGATLYNVLTGEYVYDFRGETEPLKAILEGRVVSITKRKKDLPRNLAGAIDKAIAPEPGDRYQTAGQMKDALEHALGHAAR